MISLPNVRDVVSSALAEDLGVPVSALLGHAAADGSVLDRDVTGSSVADADITFRGAIVSRQDCVVAGLPVAHEAFAMLAECSGLRESLTFRALVDEGASVAAGVAVALVEAPARLVWAAERTALDFLMLLTGMSTETARWVAQAGPGLAVCDTRKTVPGLRALSKYAVAVGGGTNHRIGLYDMVLIKDNHMARVSSIADAVARAREAHPALLIEVEADRQDQAVAAVAAGADLVLLDNMDDAELARAVAACREAAIRRGRDVLTEASGTITYERLPALRACGVDRVSTSALTLARPVDFGLDEMAPSESE